MGQIVVVVVVAMVVEMMMVMMVVVAYFFRGSLPGLFLWLVMTSSFDLPLTPSFEADFPEQRLEEEDGIG